MVVIIMDEAGNQIAEISYLIDNDINNVADHSDCATRQVQVEAKPDAQPE